MYIWLSQPVPIMAKIGSSESKSRKVCGDLNTWRCLFHTGGNLCALHRWSWPTPCAQGLQLVFAVFTRSLLSGGSTKGLLWHRDILWFVVRQHWWGTAAWKRHGCSSWTHSSVGPPASTVTFQGHTEHAPCDVVLPLLQDKFCLASDKLERPIHLISIVLELMTSFHNAGHGTDQNSVFIAAPDCNV